MKEFAEVIIDTAASALDRTFEYRVPAQMQELKIGDQVLVPFGPRKMNAYVVGFPGKTEWDPAKLKDILKIQETALPVQGEMIRLASWLRDSYGCTMQQALHTVMPVRTKRAQKEAFTLRSAASEEILKTALAEAERKHYAARARVLEAVVKDREIPWNLVQEKLHVTRETIRPLISKGLVNLDSEKVYRNPLILGKDFSGLVTLNPVQQKISDDILRRYHEGDRKPSLIHGITGSGKTEVYISLIRQMVSEGKQAIVLIPEISLTYQTVMRFYRYFGDRVSILNSRMSDGERYDQYVRAMNGEIDVMIGPRSALFTPFQKLGIIIIDEEHDGAYRSDQAPRYHTDDTAIYRAAEAGAITVLGSATPSVQSYYRSEQGIYVRYEMTARAIEGSTLPTCSVVDLRREMAEGNRSIFSRELRDLIMQMLEEKKQGMLFLNRRGYSGFISCRSCGQVIKCPHCEVSLTSHYGRKLVCHYCGYERPVPARCPSCGSPYIAGFGTGTQKVEQMLLQEFPGIRVLRMDRDTTSKKGSLEEILESFRAGEADILVGTQMIVKGHDFPKVTVVGILAADLSLFESDFRSSETTFDLLTQAAGRAGRGENPGYVVIQSYQPEHYAIRTAAEQDYASFYKEEIAYRRLMHYPPVRAMMTVLALSGDERELAESVDELIRGAGETIRREKIRIIGPAEPGISKIKDSYRRVFYAEHPDRTVLDELREEICGDLKRGHHRDSVRLQIYYD